MIKAKKDTSRVAKLQKQMLSPKKNLNVELDAALFKRFKAKVAANGETMTEILTGAILDYLA